MDDFFEIDEKKKTVKTINLDDFSIEELEKYILELSQEIERVKEEIKKKSKLITEANKVFK
tara:strand:+ start:4904 stop:5086 length:183 start_codon:yes stop_codon:yes gene_type:complete